MAVARVLVVDDSEYVRDMCARMLARGGHEVIPAADGAQALDLYQQQRPDGVILDLGLPDTQGLTVLDRLREADPNVRVAILTGHKERHVVLDAVRHGALDFVVKPFTTDRLLAAVERLIA